LLTDLTSGLKGVKQTQISPDRKHVWYLYTLLLARKRDQVKATLRAKGIGAAVYWESPVNRMPLYKKLGYGDMRLPGAYGAADHVLSLPVHPGVKPSQIEFIAEQLSKAVKA
jgi:perosamine synthetase